MTKDKIAIGVLWEDHEPFFVFDVANDPNVISAIARYIDHQMKDAIAMMVVPQQAFVKGLAPHLNYKTYEEIMGEITPRRN